MVGEDWREGARDADDPEQVGLEFVADVGQWRLEYRRGQLDAGVVDEDRDVGRRLCCCGHGGVVGDVEDQWHDPVVVALRMP